MKRRTFIQSACLGGVGLFANVARMRGEGKFVIPPCPPLKTHGLPGYKLSPMGMPGVFPGRVVEVHDRKSITDYHVSQPVVRRMLEHGIKELTGKSSMEEAWSLFVEPTDVVGIKINASGAPACYSSPEIVREIIRAVERVGVPPHNIVVYDRYSDEIQLGSYRAFLPLGVRLVGVETGSFDVSGYDMNVYCQGNLFGEWETRSYLAKVVSQEVTKIISVPTLKDHSAAGVTGCLKNVAYGSFNNMGRTHPAPITYTDPMIGTLCTIEPLRSKVVLNVMDGMREVWHGGPLTQDRNFIAQAGLLLLGTDPVAVDTIELHIIEKKRQAEGALSLWDRNPANITHNSRVFFHDPHKNLYYRQPGHIANAGKMGLGIFDMQRIEHRRINL